MSLLHIYGGDKMSQYDKTDSDEMHDLLIEMINEVGRDMEVYEIRKKPFEKRNESLRPSMAYRTADLLSYIYKKCTRAVLYYINLEDLKTIILRHRNEKVWCICIENSSDMW